MWHIKLAQTSAFKLAERLGQSAQTEPIRVVFAESCTAGLVAALLGQVPGISNFLCGSAVTYRESVKQQWLSVSAETISEYTAESFETTRAMATGVLSSTSEANFSAAVTGHIGPGAPEEIDGKIFIVVAKRNVELGNESLQKTEIVFETSFTLESTARTDRQHESAQKVLDCLLQSLA